jgi:hypothetical protein
MSQIKKAIAAAKSAAEIIAKAEAENPLAIGTPVKDRGIFAGVWEPVDREGKILGKKFRVFAAPEDIANLSGEKLLTFEEAAAEVAALKNWHGHKGYKIADNQTLHAMLESGVYEGGWIIPPREILGGFDYAGRAVWKESLFKNKDDGAFAGTFATHGIRPEHAPFYWSCTGDRDGYNWTVCFTNGFPAGYDKKLSKNYCRPVRMEPAL